MTMPKGWNPQGNSDVSKVDHLFNKAMNFYNLEKYRRMFRLL